jgi:hypothetical protein
VYIIKYCKLFYHNSHVIFVRRQRYALGRAETRKFITPMSHWRTEAFSWCVMYARDMTPRGMLMLHVQGPRGTLLVAQLVETLRYKPAGHGFNSRCCHWNFLFTLTFRPHYGPGVDSASNINEYQEYLLGVKAAGA